MEPIKEWMIRSLREESNAGVISGWLEEDLHKWVRVVSNALNALLNGVSFIVLSDEPRSWFKSYVLSHFNSPSKNRPYVPFVGIEELEMYLGEDIRDQKNIQLVSSMLRSTFKDYSFFYIGKAEGIKAELAMSHENSCLWLLDADVQNAFILNSANKMLDSRLLQLYRLFDQAISSMIYQKITLES
ncbi:HobA family DNA replication regulator [uncultured Helicobacter sp.]|uniref:HobA family DNA replication regulator n=1 Tax=uncultured Helicobacter sp. TaxID=175537 RepID=UPI001F880D22|nr:HobA family DNA replication regulator [uncultured Helicobacter sp.]HIY44772.1 HobA family DNA replication regulator [Candidatus Helicobacter avistercoris]